MKSGIMLNLSRRTRLFIDDHAKIIKEIWNKAFLTCLCSCFELLKQSKIITFVTKQEKEDYVVTATRLELEGLRLLPGELLVGEVTVLGGLEVDGLGQIELLDNDTGTEVKVVADDLDELLGGLLGSTVGLNEDGEGLSDTNGVGELDKGTTSKTSVDQGLSDPAGNVGGGTIDLGVILAGKSTTTVSTPATVGVDNDLTAGQTGVTLGTTDDEAAGGLEVVNSTVVEELSRNDLLDDLLLESDTDLLSGEIIAVLGRDDNGVDTQGLDSTVVVGVLNGDLGLGVRAEPGDGAIFTSISHGLVELVGKDDSQGEELRGLVGSITEHDTLVTSTELLEGLIIVKTLGDIRGLLLNGDQDVAGLVVETLLGRIIADILDGTTDDLLVVKLGLGSDFTEDHDHTWNIVSICALSNINNTIVYVRVFGTYQSWWRSHKRPIMITKLVRAKFWCGDKAGPIGWGEEKKKKKKKGRGSAEK